jgi:hypothetical protein
MWKDFDMRMTLGREVKKERKERTPRWAEAVYIQGDTLLSQSRDVGFRHEFLGFAEDSVQIRESRSFIVLDPKIYGGRPLYVEPKAVSD